MGTRTADPNIWMGNTDWLMVDETQLDMDLREEVSEASGGLLDSCSDYTIVPLRNGQGVVLLTRDTHDELEAVGVCRYDHDTLLVLPGHQGQGLGAFLVLAAATLKGGRIVPIELTFAGHAAHVAAHRMAIRMALATDEEVPQEVLDEHPGITFLSSAASPSP